MTLSKTSLLVLAGGLSRMNAVLPENAWCPLKAEFYDQIVDKDGKKKYPDYVSSETRLTKGSNIDRTGKNKFYQNGDCFEFEEASKPHESGMRSGKGTMYLEGHNGRTEIYGEWKDDKLEYVISKSQKVVPNGTHHQTEYLEKMGKEDSSTLYSGQMLKTYGPDGYPKYVRHGYGQLWVSGRDEMYSGMWLNDEFLVLYQNTKEMATEKATIVAVKDHVDYAVGHTREQAKTEMAAIKDQLIEQAKVDLNKLKEDVNKEIHEKLDTEATATYDIYKTERHASIRARENLDQHLKANNEAFIKILREQHEKNLKDLQAHHEKSIEEKEASVIEAIEKKESEVKEAIEKFIKENSSAALAVTTALVITIGTLLF